jgi:hypothetical protein
MMTPFNLTGIKVMIAIPCGPNLPWQTVQSLIETCCSLERGGIPYSFTMVAGCSIVEHARSNVASDFLKSDMNTLFMIDSDMAWTLKDFVRLLALSTVMEVVGAAYPAKRDDGPVFMLKGCEGSLMNNEYGCLPIGGVGLGFTVVQRKVIEQLAEKAEKVRFPWSKGEKIPYIFRCDIDNGEARGEDMAFFDDCKDLGYQLWLDPTIELGHVGTKEYRGKLQDALHRV